MQSRFSQPFLDGCSTYHKAVFITDIFIRYHIKMDNKWLYIKNKLAQYRHALFYV